MTGARSKWPTKWAKTENTRNTQTRNRTQRSRRRRRGATQEKQKNQTTALLTGEWTERLCKREVVKRWEGNVVLTVRRRRRRGQIATANFDGNKRGRRRGFVVVAFGDSRERGSDGGHRRGRTA